MMRNMLAKLQHSGRWTRDFTTSTTSTSIFKRVWDRQPASRLCLVFFGGYVGGYVKNFLERRALREKVNRMMDEHAKYLEAVFDRAYRLPLVDPKLYPSLNIPAASKTNSQATMSANKANSGNRDLPA